MELEWRPLAQQDLADLVAYIAEDSVDAAYRLQSRIEEQIALLAQFSGMGRIGRIRGTRELVITGTAYIATYRVSIERITIVRVLHGTRRWPQEL